jgi:hypothetical protein
VQLNLGDESDPRTALRDAIADAVRLITPKELCFRLGITAQYLSDALHGKNSKGFRSDWLSVVVEMAPLESAIAIMRALGERRGLEITRRKELTPEERLTRLEQRIASRFGQAGAELVEENRR